jgi:hypothetical protein
VRTAVIGASKMGGNQALHKTMETAQERHNKKAQPQTALDVSWTCNDVMKSQAHATGPSVQQPIKDFLWSYLAQWITSTTNFFLHDHD